MDVNSVGDTFVSTATHVLQRTQEAVENRKPEPDHAGTADDGGGIQTATASAAPAANLNGQKIGQTVDVKA